MTPTHRNCEIERLERELKARDNDVKQRENALAESHKREQQLRDENADLQRQIDLLNDDLAQCESDK